ncbi:anti-sigma factor [Sphingomonas sp. AOB5]|uniref:anti-sigma factor family protein n=1 Tax=Sphingomonas sp. AOB5 TaxID=3034017 RepID=UPI0023F97316|nr:anti-sigma factor [Sphingomonas sp. AOB5]MDF7777161.1 anti-sigma factor [Sphingomonas sp. AOB5]
MSIDSEMLMAYADGELDMISAKRVEKAIAADPSLGEQVEQHRKLRAMLKGAFDPVEAAPVPDRLAAMLKESAKVVPIETARKPAISFHWWRNAGAVAAALVVGVMVGQFAMPSGGSSTQAMASAEVSRALDGQLASTQGDAAVKILVSFQSADKSYCRAFDAGAQAGIACRSDQGWELRQLRTTSDAQKTEYRQAGSSEILAAAQEMMSGDPLDAAGEAAAKAKGWK